MNLFTIQETTANYIKTGTGKTKLPIYKMIILSIVAGALIAFSSAISNTAAHVIPNVGLTRLVTGLVFAFGLGMVVMTGTELFTGNCLISIPVLSKDAAFGGMLKNWVVVYLGNLVGSMLIAAACAKFGQFNYSNNGLAVYTVNIAISKCSLPFAKAVVWGILCNFLVCLGVVLALSAQDVIGRVIGAYMPVMYFVTAGFEHSIANMYYIPAGLYAMKVPSYAAAVQAAGLNTTVLTWGNFITANLIPVTLGNIIGGVLLGFILWSCHYTKPAQ